MVSDLMKRWMIAGLGLAVLTKEKVEEMVQELVRVGEVDGEESKQVARSLLKAAEEQRDELKRLVEQQVKRILAGAGMVTRDEYTALEERVKALEARFAEPAQPAAGPSDA